MNTMTALAPQAPDTQSPPLKLVVHLKGGIGNQLFQYVAGKSLARRLGAALSVDASFFSQDPYGNLAAMQAFAPALKTDAIQALAGPGTYMLKDGLLKSWQDVIQLPADARVLVTDGYWQDERLLDPEVVREVHAELANSQRQAHDSELGQAIRSQRHAIAVHLRRKDYAHMGLCVDEYYLGALNYLRQRYPDAHVYVFSDEPNCARQLLGARLPHVTFVASGTDVGDLYLMSLCQHFVISNSTYSWWAAYFAEHRGGVIVAPREWVTIAGVPSPLPARWVQMPNAVRPMAISEERVQAVEASVQRLIFDAAIRRWILDKGDQTLRLNFSHLDADSMVLDLGGYKGEWCEAIHSRYGCQVHIFEPISSFCDGIRERFAGNTKVTPHQCGLGARDESMTMSLSSDGTGAFVAAERQEQAQIREVSSFLTEHGIGQIDLMKINIEGGEFELIDRMIDTGVIQRVQVMQVQFHDFVPDAVRRHEALVSKLEATHTRTWNYEFVWEEWVRKA